MLARLLCHPPPTLNLGIFVIGAVELALARQYLFLTPQTTLRISSSVFLSLAFTHLLDRRFTRCAADRS